MSNIIRVSESSPNSEWLVMSNQGTACFLELLLYATDDPEKTEHQKELISFLEDRIFTEELHEDLRRVLQALKDAGADDSYKAPNFGYSVREFCSEGSISILFDEVFGSDGC